MDADCTKCWQGICICGEGYKDWDIEDLQNFINILQALLFTKMIDKIVKDIKNT